MNNTNNLVGENNWLGTSLIYQTSLFFSSTLYPEIGVHGGPKNHIFTLIFEDGRAPQMLPRVWPVSCEFMLVNSGLKYFPAGGKQVKYGWIISFNWCYGLNCNKACRQLHHQQSFLSLILLFMLLNEIKNVRQRKIIRIYNLKCNQFPILT